MHEPARLQTSARSTGTIVHGDTTQGRNRADDGSQCTPSTEERGAPKRVLIVAGCFLLTTTEVAPKRSTAHLTISWCAWGLLWYTQFREHLQRTRKKERAGGSLRETSFLFQFPFPSFVRTLARVTTNSSDNVSPYQPSERIVVAPLLSPEPPAGSRRRRRWRCR